MKAVSRILLVLVCFLMFGVCLAVLAQPPGGGGVGGGGNITCSMEHMLYTYHNIPMVTPPVYNPQQLVFKSSIALDLTYAGNTSNAEMVFCQGTSNFYRNQGIEYVHDIGSVVSTASHDKMHAYQEFDRIFTTSSNPSIIQDPWWWSDEGHTDVFLDWPGGSYATMPGNNSFPISCDDEVPSSFVSLGSAEFKENVNGLDYIILRNIYFCFNRLLGDATNPNNMSVRCQIEKYQDFDFRNVYSQSYVNNQEVCNYLDNYENGQLGTQLMYYGWIRYAEVFASTAYPNEQVTDNQWKVRMVLLDDVTQPDDPYRSSEIKTVTTN